MGTTQLYQQTLSSFLPHAFIWIFGSKVQLLCRDDAFKPFVFNQLRQDE